MASSLLLSATAGIPSLDNVEFFAASPSFPPPEAFRGGFDLLAGALSCAPSSTLSAWLAVAGSALVALVALVLVRLLTSGSAVLGLAAVFLAAAAEREFPCVFARLPLVTAILTNVKEKLAEIWCGHIRQAQHHDGNQTLFSEDIAQYMTNL